MVSKVLSSMALTFNVLENKMLRDPTGQLIFSS